MILPEMSNSTKTSPRSENLIKDTNGFILSSTLENSFKICSIHKSLVPNLIHILTICLFLFKATVYEEVFLLANYGILVCTHIFIYVKMESTLTFFLYQFTVRKVETVDFQRLTIRQSAAVAFGLSETDN